MKRLEDFRFEENPKIPQATIAALAQGTWIDDRESVILLGDSGTGKTHLAISLAVLACQQGRRVRFTTLAALANELQAAESRRELGRVIARYARTELVVLDELGYLALPEGAAELVFQVISERNERASLIVTTNLPFGEWTKVFPDARLAKAVVDRITHRAHIIDTGSRVLALPPRPHQSEERGRLTPTREARRRYLVPLRATRSAPRDTAASHNQRRSTTHNNRREVGPLQAAAPGPLQTAAPTRRLVGTFPPRRCGQEFRFGRPSRRFRRAGWSSRSREARRRRSRGGRPRSI